MADRHRVAGMLLALCGFAASGSIGRVRGPDPLVVLSRTTVEFAPAPEGTAGTPEIVTLLNNGAGELIISNISISGENSGDFAQEHNCPLTPASLLSGTDCAIKIIFQPHHTGELHAVLSVADNAPGSPQVIELRGRAAPAGPLVVFAPRSIDFGGVPVGGTSAGREVTLSNVGSAPLNIATAITITGASAAAFSVMLGQTTCAAAGGALPPRASCKIVIRFAPTSLGAQAAQVTLVDDAPGSPHGVPLSGRGLGRTAPGIKQE